MKNTNTSSVSLDQWETLMRQHVVELSAELKQTLQDRRQKGVSA